jgi:hypothetical protein
MDITINGKICQALTQRTGSSQNGNNWTSQDFVIETEGGERICFNIFGEDRIKESGLRVGVLASVTCKIESREWNGKWFTSIKCQKCIVQNNTTAPQQQMQSPQAKIQNEPQQFTKTSADDLPF